jgi:hypothetical protein
LNCEQGDRIVCAKKCSRTHILHNLIITFFSTKLTNFGYVEIYKKCPIGKNWSNLVTLIVSRPFGRLCAQHSQRTILPTKKNVD